MAVTLSVGFLWAGCSNAPPPPPAPRLTATLSPTEAVALKNCLLFLSVKDTTGRPLRLKHAILVLSMPSMMMPPTTVSMVEEHAGQFSGAGTFTMAGRWSADAIATSDGSEVDLGKFTINVRN